MGESREGAWRAGRGGEGGRMGMSQVPMWTLVVGRAVGRGEWGGRRRDDKLAPSWVARCAASCGLSLFIFWDAYCLSLG